MSLCSWYSSLDGIGGRVNGGANSVVGGATADIAAHGAVDFGVAGRGILLEQRGRRHHLTGLAITALRHLVLNPRGLYGFGLTAFESLDGAHLAARHRG